ncbi:hypothetical protein HS125_01470 [bacterium]|nr:hypothetical protein [bacterium]
MKRWLSHLVVAGLLAAACATTGYAEDVFDRGLRNLDGQVSTDVRSKVNDVAQSIAAQAGRAYFDNAVFPTNLRYDAAGEPLGNRGGLYNEPFWTVGQREFLSGVYFSHWTFEEFDGDDLSNAFNIDEPFTVFADTPIPGVDTLRRTAVRGGADLDYDVLWISAVYGLTDRIDVGLAVPMMWVEADATLDYGLHLQQVDRRVAPPVTTDILPLTFVSNRRSRDEQGLGDIIGRLKWNVFDELKDDTPVSWTLGLDAKFPSGDEEDLLGTGNGAVRFRTQLAKDLDRFVPQLELAYVVGEDDVADEDYNSFQYKVSLPFLVSEFENSGGEAPGSLTIALELLGDMSELADHHDVAVSARLGLGHRFSFNGGVRIPYSSSDALTPDWSPTVGVEFRW